MPVGQPLRSERPADLFYLPGEAKPLFETAHMADDKLVRIAQTLLGDNRSHLFVTAVQTPGQAGAIVEC